MCIRDSSNSRNEKIYGNINNNDTVETEDTEPKKRPVNQNQTYQHLKSVRRHKEEAGIYATLAETF